ncbi:Plm2p RNJ42_02584 [Nakaseomyces bracarensis]|uniref:Plm2p n=1 Tax=Nakaseomyces bracarensis TaxID=273131 RepID=UPI0038710C84
MKLPPSSPCGYHEEGNGIDQEADVFNYPSPEPSSSIGRSSSSPVQLGPEQRQDSGEVSKSNYILSIANNDARQFTIGRKGSICDITLPKLPFISRQHVFVQFLNHKNQLKITCNGTNIISVLLAKKHPFVLIKTKKLNEFVLEGDVQNCNPEDIHYLDAFTLRNNDVVYMPALRDISLSISDIKIELNVYTPSPKLCESSHMDSDLSTDTDEDSKLVHISEEAFPKDKYETPSKKLIPVPQSPSTGKVLQPLPSNITNEVITPSRKEIVTPFYRKFTIPEPTTPIKKSSKIRAALNNNTPVPIRKRRKMEMKEVEGLSNKEKTFELGIEKSSGRLKFFETFTKTSLQRQPTSTNIS